MHQHDMGLSCLSSAREPRLLWPNTSTVQANFSVQSRCLSFAKSGELFGRVFLAVDPTARQPAVKVNPVVSSRRALL